MPVLGCLKLSAENLETIFGTPAWLSPAVLEVNSSDSFYLMAKLESPSGLISNTNCVRENEVHNIEEFDSENLTYIGFINTSWTTLTNIQATLLDEDGVAIGALDIIVLDKLTAKAAAWIT